MKNALFLLCCFLAAIMMFSCTVDSPENAISTVVAEDPTQPAPIVITPPVTPPPPVDHGGGSKDKDDDN